MNRFVLPPRQPGSSNEELTDVRSIVIVGANGSGKSRLGYWIEQNNGHIGLVHRISAQRALTAPDAINPRSYERATWELRYGRYEPSWNEDQHKANKIGSRWANEPLSHMLTDYEIVLATLFADEGKRNQEYARAAQAAVPTAKPSDCSLDMLQRIWAVVFPHRELVVGSHKISARIPGGSQSYSGTNMSDGERVAIYLLGQALSSPADAIIVIDEPEIHLYRAIQATLWDQIETARPDCIFVYITHDLECAATRTTARKIWLKNYDGSTWEWEALEARPGLPEQLLLHVLGSRRPVLFVEGDQTSHDAAVYRALYPNKLIVPLSNCENVIEANKAMRQLEQLHHLDVGGLVDRDHRSDEEIAAFKARGLEVVEVAEVENLICIPAALSAAAAQLKHPDAQAAIEAAKQRVLTELKKGVDAQIAARAIAEIQFKLGGFGPKVRNADAATIQQEMEIHVETIDVAATFKTCRELFQNILANADYEKALRYYNCKGTTSFVAAALGISTEAYCRIIVGILRSDPDSKLATEMRSAIS